LREFAGYIDFRRYAMNLSIPFIKRPIATTLLTVGVALAGMVAFALLPVSPLPRVDIPIVYVSATMPGADPETMANNVAAPLERQFGRIGGVSEMSSTSTQQSSGILLQFDLDRDIDGAARDVQAAIVAARIDLPASLRSNPIYRKFNSGDAPIMILALTSNTLTAGQIYDSASTVIAQKLSQISGVGNVGVNGGSLPAVRVELNPNALNHYGVALEDVRVALASANANRPKGFIEDGARQWQIATTDQAKKADQYRSLVVAYRNGAPVLLSNLGTVVDSVESLRNAGIVNGKPAVLIIVSKQPNANIIETVDRIRTLMPQLKASIPADIDMVVMQDRTTTIRASLHDIERTLCISVALVILVVFLFLRNLRSTLIPSIAVPISLIGTCGVMYLCGYSLNNFSLMALTISAGFVVDDAIVVLENVSRHLEEGMTPIRAAVRGAREVGFTVLSMSISLVAVFIPMLLAGGIVGRFFHEFAVTLSAAVLVSLAVSLTTTPVMCSRLLTREAERQPGRLYRATERFFDWLLLGYERSLERVLRHPRLTMLTLFCVVLLNFFLFVVVPKGFFPQQDIGIIQGSIVADQSSSFQAMQSKLRAYLDIIGADPAVLNASGFTGGGQTNGGTINVALKPLSERNVSADDVVNRLRDKLAKIPGAVLYLQASQDLGGGGGGNAQYQYALEGESLSDLKEWAPRVLKILQGLPQLVDVSSSQQDKGLQMTLTIDRATAARLGVTESAIDNALSDAFGQRLVSIIYENKNQYHVVMEVAPEYLQNPDTLKGVYVANLLDQLVPLSAFSHFEATNAILSVTHKGQFPSVMMSFNLKPKVALSDATEAIDQAVAQSGMPASIRGDFQGNAQKFRESSTSMPMLILVALATIYIVLGVLYESLVHPITILSTLPSAGIGALLALLVFGIPLDIMSFVGIFLLIGIVKKNAIMMIDFALVAQRTEGKSPIEAIRKACLLRFRPIMMTTMAALLSALPLALGTGTGYEMRRPLGVTIVGGLILSQMLTLYTTPVVYLYMERLGVRAARFGQWVKRRRDKLSGKGALAGS
jgi:multidrug efflux pump